MSALGRRGEETPMSGPTFRRGTAAQLLSGQRVLVCDGAMGTMLHAAGAALDRSLPELNLSDPGLVATIHDSYLSAGADIIQANTFGANGLWLADHGFPDKVAEINRAGVRLARAAADRSGRRVLVAGSVSPAVTALQRRRVGADERMAVIREQILALVADGAADLLILETFGYLDELVEAISVAASVTDLPLIAQATFADDAHTLGGETPREVATVLSGLPVTMIGTNCTVGPQRMLAVAEDLVRYSAVPVSAQPNAGQPRRTGPRSFEFAIDGGYFSRYLARFADAGVTAIHAVKKAIPVLTAGTTAVVIGAGGLGHIGIQCLKAMTPAQIIVIDPSEQALALAGEMGADQTVKVDGTHVETVTEMTNGLGAEAIIDFVGEKGAIEDGIAMIRDGGFYYVIGYGENINIPTIDVISREISFIGNLVGTYADLQELMTLTAEGKVTLHTSTYPLEAINDAMADLDGGRLQGRGILIPAAA